MQEQLPRGLGEGNLNKRKNLNIFTGLTMHDTQPLLANSDFPAIFRTAGNPASQPRLPVQPELRALPRQRRAKAHRTDESGNA
jgi:hypothetical protein